MENLFTHSKERFTKLVKAYFVDAKCKYCPRRVWYTGTEEMTREEHEAKKVCELCHQLKTKEING